MAMAKGRARLRSICLCMVPAWVGLLVVPVQSVAARGAGAATQSTTARASLQNLNSGTVQLPGGRDPMEVVRTVERNRGGLAHEGSMREVDETSRPRRAEMEGEVGPAFQIGGPSAAPEDQYYAAIAFDGTNYLVVWEDYRNGIEGDIYGARVSADGAVLDSAGIAISTAMSDQLNPAIAFDGTNYLVVWEDKRSPNDYIYGARVSVGGSVLDPAGMAISTGVYDLGHPAIAFDGTNYLVVWQQQVIGSNDDIYGARVSVGGSVLDPAGIAISTATSDQRFPAIAFDGTNYLVVWQDDRGASAPDIYGARVSVGGSVLDPAGIAICQLASGQERPGIAFDGTNYLVVWGDFRSATSWDIYGARVSAGGVVLDGMGVPVSTPVNDQMEPAIAFDGTNYLVVWHDLRSGNYDVYCARVDVGGGVLDLMGVPVSAGENVEGASAIAFDGTNYFVVWADDRSARWDVYGARVSAGGGVLDPTGRLVSTGAVGDEWYAAVAFDGTNYLVVWEDHRSGSTYDIYGARVNVAGDVLDPAGIAISTATSDQRFPAIAFDGTNYLVVWHDYRYAGPRIYGARVSIAGSVLDTGGIAISTAEYTQYNPAVAFDGTNYLVAWEDYRNGLSDIYGARVNVAGDVLDPTEIGISKAASRQSHPAIAFDGTNYLVVWEDLRSDLDGDIYGARVSVGGNVLDAAGIPISIAVGPQLHPAIAFDGTDYFAVWGDRRSDPIGDIYGARVDVGGSVLDPVGIAISTMANYYGSAVAFDGTNYLVVWQNTSYHIYGARVTPAGVVLDPSGLAICTASAGEHWPCASMGTAGQVIICYGYDAPGEDNYWLIWGNIWGAYVGVEQAEAPKAYKMCQSYPNPFNPICTIRYDVPRAGRLNLRVFDVRGSLVRTLVDGWREPGVYSEVWDGRRDDGGELPSGVYFCRVEASDFRAVHKIVLLK